MHVAEVGTQRGVQTLAIARPQDQRLDVERQREDGRLVVEVEQELVGEIAQGLTGDAQGLGGDGGADGGLRHPGGQDVVQVLQIRVGENDVEDLPHRAGQALGGRPDRAAASGGQRLPDRRQHVAGADPIGGDGQVHHEIVQDVLVDIQPRLGQMADRGVVQPAGASVPLRAVQAGQAGLAGAEQQVAHQLALLPFRPLDADDLAVAADHQLVLAQEFPGAAKVGLDGGRAHAETLPQFEDVRSVGVAHQVANDVVEPLLGAVVAGTALAARVPVAPVGALVEAVAVLVGDDQRSLRAGVDGAHVVADAAGGHSQAQRQLPAGQPSLCRPQLVDKLLLALMACLHGSSLALLTADHH